MTVPEEVLTALMKPCWTFGQEPPHGASSPGLYALHTERSAWKELGLQPRDGGLPVYVGKAEGTLLERDIGTHFACGETGRSTVRRSLAALLRERLDLRPVRRGDDRLDATKYAANFGL